MSHATITGRNIFIWQLGPVLKSEMGVRNFAQKAQKAQLSSVWIKVAVGASPYARNIGDVFESVRDALGNVGITIWGWHEPRCNTTAVASEEARLVADLAVQLDLEGILMDAESPEGRFFFQGGADEAEAYAGLLRELLEAEGKGLAICSHDVPHFFPDFPLEAFARHAHVNAPQVYYGASQSVKARLERAIEANSMIGLPFVPVGAGWIGENDGGCASASACAERALLFMNLVREYGFPGYSFWHWGGAPSRLWEVLFDFPVDD